MVDVLAIGAHPDDVELRIGGTLAALRRQGHSTSILHLTRGEMSTRGTVERRAEESARAAATLGAAPLEILDLGDGRLQDTPANRGQVTQVIRRLQPLLLLVPHPNDEHPDHAAAGQICKAAWYLAGIRKVAPTDAAPHRPRALWFYPGHEVPEPSLVVAITLLDQEQKRAAIRCYASQFHDPDSREPATRISEASFLEGCEARSRYFGSIIGAEFGEPFVTLSPTPVRDPLGLFA